MKINLELNESIDISYKGANDGVHVYVDGTGEIKVIKKMGGM